MSDQVFEDRFANEGSGSRVSDFSVSSGGDPFRSGAESPNFEKDMGFNSPPQPSRDISSSMANFRRDVDGIPRPQVIYLSIAYISSEMQFSRVFQLVQYGIILI